MMLIYILPPASMRNKKAQAMPTHRNGYSPSPPVDWSALANSVCCCLIIRWVSWTACRLPGSYMSAAPW